MQAFRNGEQCSGCLRCRRVCGGESLHDKAFSLDNDPLSARPLECYSAHADDPDIRRRGQSGGAVTALLVSLLQGGIIHGVVTTFMPEDGSLRPYAKLVRSENELRQSQGSKYLSVSFGEPLRVYFETKSLKLQYFRNQAR